MLAAGGIVPPASAAAPTMQQQSQQSNDRTPAPAPVITAKMVRRLLGSGTYLMYERPHPIWLGTPKRGNRRGRSRWNYNR